VVQARWNAVLKLENNQVFSSLLLSYGYETCEWDAIVGFSATPMRWALLGHSGFLEFFDVQLLGARREIIIIPNTAFAGQQSVVPAPTP
jgi:hypothetical protein